MEVFGEWVELAATLKTWLADWWDSTIWVLAAMAEHDNRADANWSSREY